MKKFSATDVYQSVYTAERDPEGGIRLRYINDAEPPVNDIILAKQIADRVEDMIVRERDEKNGVWRSKKYPHITVREREEAVHVYDEKEGFVRLYRDCEAFWQCDSMDEAYTEWRMAHPRPDWHAPEEGEIWALTTESTKSPEVYKFDQGRFRRMSAFTTERLAGDNLAATDIAILHGEKIWPKDESE